MLELNTCWSSRATGAAIRLLELKGCRSWRAAGAGEGHVKKTGLSSRLSSRLQASRSWPFNWHRTEICVGTEPIREDIGRNLYGFGMCAEWSLG